MSRVAVRKPIARVATLEAPTGLYSIARILPSGRSLLVGFGLILGAIALYAGARVTSLFAVQQVEVQGAPPRVAGRVEEALGSLAGTSLPSVDAADIDRALAGLPDVQAIDFDRAYPRTLRVTVVAERPVAVLRRGADAWLISERGRVLRGLPGARPALLPRIWVARLAAPRDGSILTEIEAREPALALGVVLAAHPTLVVRIRDARAQDGEINLVLRSGTEIRLGSSHDLALKLAAARQTLAELETSGEGYVDVSVPERPVSGVESQVSG
ncbi:MAG: FtsQ-type POTRA domain-containing protein [Actinobacteria bacterium]|nr:FtsQ-type POTRA domain-containing protein [Actinomycetota bacterium]